MQLTLTPEQIQTARVMRTEGKSYPEIVEALGGDVSRSVVRAHCLDIRSGDGEVRTRVDKPVRTRADGATIRGFTAEEDAEIIDWHTINPEVRGNLNQLAIKMGRKRHSVAARIKTLVKHERLTL